MARTALCAAGLLLLPDCLPAQARQRQERTPQASAEQLAALAKDCPQTPAEYALPPVYPWMLRDNLRKADWLGQPYEGKTLYEPVNIIIKDAVSASAEEAQQLLLSACRHAGWRSRFGHSSDYTAFLGGALAPLFPPIRHHAFSDRPFEEDNNHGRVFGPVRYGGAFYFCAAFSRENVHLHPVTHKYRSFNQARDAFAWSLDGGGLYKVAGFVHLRNALVGDASAGTGDHDGMAALLELNK